MQTAILITAIAIGAPALKDPPKKDLKIVGEWVVERMTSGGREYKSSSERHFTFTGDGKWMLSMVRKGKATAPSKIIRTYTLDAKAAPAAIDMKTTETLDRPNMVGIVKVEGDTLTLCYGRKDDRPRKFESPEGSTIVLVVMKRVKKD